MRIIIILLCLILTSCGYIRASITNEYKDVYFLQNENIKEYTKDNENIYISPLEVHKELFEVFKEN